MSGAPTPKPINNDLRNREAIEVLAGFRPPERMHAVRKGDIGDIQAYVDAIRAAVSAAEARLIAFASNIAAQQADLAQLNADVQAALAELGDLQASLPGGVLADQWEIEITGMVEVSAIRLASNPGELAGA